MAVYDTKGRPVHVDIQTAYTAGVQGVGVSTLGNTGGNTGTSTGTIVLAGSNNVTVKQSTGAGGVTAWIDVSAAGAADGVNIISLSGNTSGTLATQSTGTVVFAGGNNITLSQSSNTITISGGGGGGAAISAGTQSQNTGTVVFSNASGVSFGLNAGTLTASVKTDYLTTAALSDHTHSQYAGTNGAITGGSITVNTSGVSVNLPAYLTTAAASTHSHGNPTLNLTNISGTTASASNGLTLSLSVGNYLTTAAASNHTHGSGPSITGPISVTSNSSAWSLSIGNYLTTARASNDGVGLNTAGTNVTWTVNSSGISLNAGAYLTTAAASDHSHAQYLTTAMASNASTNFAGIGETTGTTTGTDLKMTVDTAGVNISFPKWLTTAMGSDAGTGFMSTSERGNYFYTSNNTFANSTHSHGNPTLALTNASGTTASASNGLTLSLSVGNYLTTAANSTHSHGNPTLALTNLTGTTASASNGLTISLSANPAGGADGYNIISASGNTAGVLTSYTTGTLVLVGGNNITLSQNSNSITISGANLGGAQTGISGIGASDTTFTSGTVIWSGQNNITVGTSLNGASQYVRLSVGNYLTTAAASDHTHAYAGTNGAITGGSITVNTSGVSVNLPAYLTTAAASNHSHSLNEIQDPSADKVFQLGTRHLQFQYAGGGTFSTNATRQGLFEIDANVNLTDGADIVHVHNTLANAAVDMVHVLGAGTGVTLLRLDAGASIAAEINAPLKFTGGSVPLVLGTSQSNLVSNLNANYLQGKLSSEFQSTGAYLTTAAQVSHTHGNPTLALTNLTGTTASASNGLTLSLSAAAPVAQTQQPMYYSASGTSSSSNTIQFGNTQGVSFSLSNGSIVATVKTDYLTTAAQSNQVVNSFNGSTGQISLATGSSLSSSSNGSTITIGLASNITTALQSAGAYLTTAAASNHTHGTGPSITGAISVTSNSSAWSLSIGPYLTTAAQSNQVVNSINGSTGQISLATGSSLSSSSNGSTITFGLASNITTALQSAGAYLTTAAASNHTHGSGPSITGPISVTSNSGAWSISISNYLTTAAASDHSHGNPTLALTNLTGTTASASNGLTISLSAAAPGAAAITQSIGLSNVTAGGATGGTSGMVTGDDIQYVFVPGSNVTMSQSINGSTGTISIYAGGGGGGAAVGISTDGQTSGNTGTYSSGTYLFAGSNSLTLHQSTGGGGVHTLWLKPAMSQLTAGNLISLSSNGSTVSVIGLGAGTGTSATNASITLNTAGLAISVGNGGGGGIAAGVSNTGNTAGNTGTYSTGTIVFAASNSMTLSQSSGGASVHTIWLQPLMWALSGGGGISLSTTGSTIVIYTVA